MNTLDYNSIGQRAYATAQEKGWYSDGGPDFGTRVALIHSEVSEALEAWRKDKNCTTEESILASISTVEHGLWILFFEDKIKGTVGDELADVVIRCCESLAHFGIDANALNAGSFSGEVILQPSFGACLAVLHRKISWCGISNDDSENHKNLKRSICHTEWIANRFNIDLASHIEAKLRYNQTRPHRHGGKKC